MNGHQCTRMNGGDGLRKHHWCVRAQPRTRGRGQLPPPTIPQPPVGRHLVNRGTRGSPGTVAAARRPGGAKTDERHRQAGRLRYFVCSKFRVQRSMFDVSLGHASPLSKKLLDTDALPADVLFIHGKNLLMPWRAQPAGETEALPVDRPAGLPWRKRVGFTRHLYETPSFVRLTCSPDSSVAQPSAGR